MDSAILSPEGGDVLHRPFVPSFFPSAPTDYNVESAYLVSISWWKEAVRGGCCGSSGGVDGASALPGVLYNATLQLHDSVDNDGVGSNILVDLRRERESGEEGVSGGLEGFVLLSEWMFFTSLKWHFDNKCTESSLHVEDIADIFLSLQISILYTRKTKRLVIMISPKVNGDAAIGKANSILFSKSSTFQIWDYSGHMDKLCVYDSQSCMKSIEEINLKLQIYGLPYTFNDKEARNEDMMMKLPETNGPLSSSSLSVDNVDGVSRVSLSSEACNGFLGCGSFSLGLTGLQNLGNTCYMNSAIQCLMHTPKLVEYFLGNFIKDLNCGNTLGMNGKLAIAFGDLLRKLWTPGAESVAPSMIKSIVSSYASQFSGYQQHDSQELLSFMLDGLHEDLNRVKKKPCNPANEEEDDHPDEEVADKNWKNHLSRNDSIIADLCQGQYRSSLVCSICQKSSFTFEPFMNLSLPLSSSARREITLTMLSTDGTELPYPITITVPKVGTLKDLFEVLGLACSLRDDERLLVAEIFNNSICQMLDHPDDSLEIIKDNDQLVSYRIPKDVKGGSFVVFTQHELGKSYPYPLTPYKKFAAPLVASIPGSSNGSRIYEVFLKIVKPFLLPSDEFLNDDDDIVEGTVLDGGASNSENESKSDSEAQPDFEFHLKSSPYLSSKMQMNEPLPILEPGDAHKVHAFWSEKMMQEYDTSTLSTLPVACETSSKSEWTQDSLSLYECVDTFLREEPLGPDNMWFCPNCKVHRQASKKLDLWRLPEVLVLHLKRFSYTESWINKLDTDVDFPVDDLDLSKYVSQNSKEASHRYSLYAVINHYGGMGNGHYTAFANDDRLGGWYEFDDRSVLPISDKQIKSPAAYVLFYKRI